MQACEELRLSLHALVAVAATATAKVGTLEVATVTCADDEITAAPVWQAKSARDKRVKRGAHSSHTNDHAHASAPTFSHPQQNVLSFAARKPFPLHANSKHAKRTLAEQDKNFAKSRAITCVKCGKSWHVASACNTDAQLSRKCYACCGIGHMTRDCVTRVAQAKLQASFSTSNAGSSEGNGATQVFASATIAEYRIADALIDTGSAFSMLSSAMYSMLRDVFAIQPFTRVTPDVVGLKAPALRFAGLLTCLLKLLVCQCIIHNLWWRVSRLPFL